MAITASVKRRKQKTIDNLLREIQALELSHKQTGAPSTLDSLTGTRQALLEEMGKKYRRRVTDE